MKQSACKNSWLLSIPLIPELKNFNIFSKLKFSNEIQKIIDMTESPIDPDVSQDKSLDDSLLTLLNAKNKKNIRAKFGDFSGFRTSSSS